MTKATSNFEAEGHPKYPPFVVGRMSMLVIMYNHGSEAVRFICTKEELKHK